MEITVLLSVLQTLNKIGRQAGVTPAVKTEVRQATERIGQFRLGHSRTLGSRIDAHPFVTAAAARQNQLGTQVIHSPAHGIPDEHI